MRRPINWLVFSLAVSLLLANLMLAGCGGGGGDDSVGDEQPAVSGMLRKVRSASELEDSLKSSLPEVASPAVIPPGGGVTLVGSAAGFSGTYTAEAGVDEFDYVRYDGSHLYVAPTAWASTQGARSIRILRTDPVSGTATQVSAIPIEGQQQVQGLYVANGRLVMLTSESNFMPYGEIWIALFVWQPTELAVQVFDVDDPAHPRKILHAELDGVFVATRRVGDRVYLVTRHSPQVPRDSLGRLQLAGQTLNDLLPRVTASGRTSPLVKPSDCYITNGPEHHAYPILTTITSFSMRSPGDFASVCYNEEANGVYASSSALYVSQPRFQTTGMTATRIHKFALTETAPTYAGSVEVPGMLWVGGQRDFRMNEHEGMLRVVTTESTEDPTDRQDHRLYVLRPKAGETALEVLSTLPNNARPEEIGKPNDGLYGVRFVGDRAYAITFRQVDPLYVLDLANPADPRIAGQLEIPGFAEFLHPVTQDLLLGLGNDASKATLELFDVSQIEHPQSRGRIVLDGQSSYSEAMWERHAFTWLPAEAADRIAIPATVMPYAQAGVAVYPQSSLHQFEILGKQSAGSASLQAAGVVSPPVANDYERYAGSSRSFIHGDSVYYVRDGKVWSTSWFAPSQVQGPF